MSRTLKVIATSANKSEDVEARKASSQYRCHYSARIHPGKAMSSLHPYWPREKESEPNDLPYTNGNQRSIQHYKPFSFYPCLKINTRIYRISSQKNHTRTMSSQIAEKSRVCAKRKKFKSWESFLSGKWSGKFINFSINAPIKWVRKWMAKIETNLKSDQRKIVL